MSKIQDGHEPWYTQEGASNRMILALRSPVPHEIDWALGRLVRTSFVHHERMFLERWHESISALLIWPSKLVAFARVESARYGDAVWEVAGDELQTLRSRAAESLLVLRNAGLIEANGNLLCAHQGLRDYLPAFLTLPSHLLTDQLAEHLLLTLDLLHSLSLLDAFPLDPVASPVPTSLVPLLKTRDRSILVSTLQLVASFSSPSSSSDPLSQPFLPPSHPLVQAGVAAALTSILLGEPASVPVRTAALDVLYLQTSDPALAVDVLRRPDLATVLRLLVQRLHDDVSEEVLPWKVSGYAQPEAEGPPSQEELVLLSRQPEPTRAMHWIKRNFVASPDAHVTQVDFWKAYKGAFGPAVGKVGVAPLLVAGELIKQAGVSFPGAHATVMEPRIFIIKGFSARPPQLSSSKGSYVPSPTSRAAPKPPYTSHTIRRLVAPVHAPPPTSIDQASTPTGIPLLAALVLRNLARAASEALLTPGAAGGADAAAEDASGAEQEKDEGKAKKVREGEMFGLPVPDISVALPGAPVAGDGDDEMDGGQGRTDAMTDQEGERARGALRDVEGGILAWAMEGDSGLGVYLGEILDLIAQLE